MDLKLRPYVITALWAMTVWALGTSDIAAQTTTVRKDTISPPRHGIVGAPYVKYSPETGWAGGLVGLYYFHLSSDSMGPSRPSSVSGGASYTQKKQFGVGLHYDLYFSEDIYHLYGALDLKSTPFNFYGVGNNNPAERTDIYTPVWLGGAAKFTKRIQIGTISQGFNAGLGAEFRHDNIIASDSGGPIKTGTIPGANGGYSSGIGVTANYDTRDNTYSTHEGQFAALDAMFYGRALGSDFTFSKWSLDTREFIPVFDDHVIALQGLFTVAYGHQPFYMMSGLGGEYNMRGYYQGRFRDNDMAVVQAEYRLPIWWRFGFVAFADVGEVANTLGGFTLHGLHWTFGPGIRLMIVPKQHLGVRLDYGIASDSRGLYFSVMEAF